MKKKIVVLALVSVLYILFFPVFFHNVLYKQYTINIHTAGEKCPESGGTEVWINRILADGQETDLSAYALADGWEYNGRIFSSGSSECTLTLKLHAVKKIEIEFVTHPYSGIVQIQSRGKKTDTVNLYSDTESYVIKDVIID